MATGTVKWFAQALHDLGNKIHDLDTDALNLGIVTTTTVPTVSTAAPHWGGTGTTNFAANQVVTTGTSYTGPKVLGTKEWTLTATGGLFGAAVISMPQDASGFTNGAYGIIYNNTDVNKRALGWVELSAAGTLSLVTGAIEINWSGAGDDILSIDQA